MNEYYEMQMYLWRDLASELMEFIEYELRLTPGEERTYQAIIAKYNEGRDGE